MHYLNILVRLAISFLFIIISINLTGKDNLAPTSAMDQIQNYVLGSIIGGVVYNVNITLFQFTIVLLIWSLLILVSRYMAAHNDRLKKFLNGDPITLVKDGQLLVDNCLKANLPAQSVVLKLRMNDVRDLRDVKRAIIEQNGQLTIIRTNERNLIYPLITDGVVDPDALELIDKDRKWLKNELHAAHIKHIRNVYLAEYQDGKVHFYPYTDQQQNKSLL
ncbi:membrane protein [Lactobacillus selangorensis]|uniref:Membrane protein n=1 Tax=Lactobacillus selangorensis TaxID=81857 RepID=A0A0R2FIF1_9LACO|nr:membrane protein [Lactobacillus selangorensis]KRN31934.1 membrane protein [Lactobacillus selangorensis]